ncbi:VCBS repeat-containing protein [Phaeobacter sp. J2-8]|uniref:FG-GAP repeat domain-containing protein n=1 Tax=Phaeobacter sp. J2-8 TaxID=2931394 RepID=UPI001FD1CFB8|nr:VCBS repeat-containing protein [Phaeobacter sp. J2-8]MCJ7872198.1 VCBS repeat-containing protein [Phaeobacter sp. J2-8]
MRNAPQFRIADWRAEFCGAFLASAMLLASTAGLRAEETAPCVGTVTGAEFQAPTNRYPHGVLGDDLEWGALRISYRSKSDCRSGSGSIRARLPEAMVFEDVAPRLVDLDGRDHPEVIVVESHQTLGARLAVWGIQDESFTRLAATPFIGTRFRWLAPLGAADLDGDGQMELAYVDRPHLARTLRVWRYETRSDGAASGTAPATLVEVAALVGVTNHRIGESDIAGGIRTCGDQPEMIVADANWQEVLAVTLAGGDLRRRTLGPHRGRESFATAMACDSLR